MITLKASEDLNWEVITAVAYEQARFDIAPELLASVERGRGIFNELIEAGAPCYGVTTGLGRLSTTDLSTEARDAISRNILLARAAAFGEPLPRPVVRAMMMVRLANAYNKTIILKRMISNRTTLKLRCNKNAKQWNLEYRQPEFGVVQLQIVQ